MGAAMSLLINMPQIKLNGRVDPVPRISDEHVHQPQLVAPSGGVGTLLTAGDPAWTLGGFSGDIIAAGFVPDPFDLHWVDIEDPDTVATYELVFYYGPTDIEACRSKFTRLTPQYRSWEQHLQSVIFPAGSRVRAKCMASVAGALVSVSIFYHTYP